MLLQLALSALALNGIGAYLLFLEVAKRAKNRVKDTGSEGTEWKVMWRKKQVIIFGSVMTLICIGVAISLSILNEDNTFLFNIKRICLLSLLWPAAYIDFKSYRIPNLFIIAGFSYRIIIFFFELIFESDGILLRAGTELIASAALVIATLLCGLVLKDSIGFGDVKLFAVMGLMLGLNGIWSSIFVSLIVSFIISVLLLATRKKKRKDMMPFAPALMIGTYLSVLITGM